jgi:hypothetical protein
MGVRRVRNEVSVEVERALLGTSLHISRTHSFRTHSFFSSPFEKAQQGHMRYRLMTDV